MRRRISGGKSRSDGAIFAIVNEDERERAETRAERV